MLPYTPLHVLLLQRAPGFPDALIMTSGNVSDEPIVTDNAQARARLASLADAFLLHDRPIYSRCDDSVVRLVDGAAAPEKIFYPLRRARGYAPQPVRLWRELPSILAVGAELKNTFCLTRERYAFLSPHVGDLQNLETLQAFEEGVTRLQSLFRVQPQALAYDLHPDYLSTRYALQRAAVEGLPAVGVQHHHAHVASLMAEHGLGDQKRLLGVIFDGTGFGEDGAIWGGEFLVAGYAGFQRPYHLAPAPLPGGDLAVRQPWRYALALLAQVGLPWDEALAPVQHGRAQTIQGVDPLPVLRQQLQRGLNCPLTSSMGRLFDAVASLAGVRQRVHYEGQAAIELEALVDPSCDGAYDFDLRGAEIDPAPLMQALVADLHGRTPLPLLAARFHNGVARMVLEICRRLRADTGLSEVGLSGGVWQNVTLLEKSWRLLAQDGFTVYAHRQVPANDGGLALGQALVAAYHIQERM
jgi:hydrogenase maturation protein HypF